MIVVSAKLSIAEIECVLGIRCNQARAAENKKGPAPRSNHVLPGFSTRETPTVRDFIVSPGERLAAAVASATIVRDVAALGAMVLFGTMLVLVLSSADLFA